MDNGLSAKREKLLKLDLRAQAYASQGFISAAAQEAGHADLIRQDITEFYTELFAPLYDDVHYQEQLAA